MTSYSIIGKGNMGSSIGGLLQNAGTVDYVTRDQIATASLGDVVVLALPYPAVDGVLEQLGSKLDGKVVVDITNPLDFDTFDSLVVPAGSSATEQIQQKLPQAKVLKAFNTNFAATLASKKVGGLQTTVLVAGDDADAKKTLLDAVTAAGLTGVDAGSLKRAHELEALGFLQLTLAAGEKISWTGGFGLVH